MMTKTKRLSTLASASFDENSRPLGAAAVDMAKRFCVIPVPWRAWLVGLGLAVGIILTTGGSAIADPHKPPPCTSVVNGGTVFEILDNQTYALCAASSCTVFNEVAYCKCDVLSGDSISLALDFDTDQNVCTVNMDGVKNGYMVSTFSPPASVLKGGDQASYTCPGATPTKAGSASKAPRGSHPRFSMRPWRKTRSSAPVRSPSRARRTRWAIISSAPILMVTATHLSSRTAIPLSPIAAMASRSLSALQPVRATFWPSSSLAPSQNRTGASRRPD